MQLKCPQYMDKKCFLIANSIKYLYQCTCAISTDLTVTPQHSWWAAKARKFKCVTRSLSFLHRLHCEDLFRRRFQPHGRQLRGILNKKSKHNIQPWYVSMERVWHALRACVVNSNGTTDPQLDLWADSTHPPTRPSVLLCIVKQPWCMQRLQSAHCTEDTCEVIC